MGALVGRRRAGSLFFPACSFLIFFSLAPAFGRRFFMGLGSRGPRGVARFGGEVVP